MYDFSTYIKVAMRLTGVFIMQSNSNFDTPTTDLVVKHTNDAGFAFLAELNIMQNGKDAQSWIEMFQYPALSIIDLVGSYYATTFDDSPVWDNFLDPTCQTNCYSNDMNYWLRNAYAIPTEPAQSFLGPIMFIMAALDPLSTQTNPNHGQVLTVNYECFTDDYQHDACTGSVVMTINCGTYAGTHSATKCPYGLCLHYCSNNTNRAPNVLFWQMNMHPLWLSPAGINTWCGGYSGDEAPDACPLGVITDLHPMNEKYYYLADNSVDCSYMTPNSLTSYYDPSTHYGITCTMGLFGTQSLVKNGWDSTSYYIFNTITLGSIYKKTLDN